MPPALLALFERIGGPRRAAMLLVGLVAAVAIWGVAQWATAPTWMPLYPGLAAEQVGDLTDRLTKAAIPYRLDAAGTQVLVAATDVARARVAVAKSGELPGGARPGFELFDQPSWGQTDLTQRVNYRRALEGELERTIGKLQGIESARVSFVMHEAEAYGAEDRPTEASVVLHLKSGEPPAAEVVTGIAHLVAASAEGLTSDHVTIVDRAGRLLTQAEEPASIAGLTTRQLDVQRTVERDLQGKAERLLQTAVGPGNARVQVTALLNFDRVERSSSTVDPERQAIATEQKAEIVPGPQGGAGSTNSATSYQNTTMTESVAPAVGGIRRLSVAVLLSPPVADSGAPAATRAPEELAQLELLVRSAVGYDSTRGDVVSLVMIPAPATPVVADAPAVVTIWDRLREFQRLIVAVTAMIAALILTLSLMKRVAAPVPPARTLAAGGGSLPRAGAVAALADGAPAPLRSPAREVPVIEIAPNPLRDKVQASVDQEPKVAGKVMRALLQM